MSAGAYEHILTDKQGAVGIITLNRPKALNALCDALMVEVNAAALAFDQDPDVGAMVLHGSDRAFAAGADIKEMADRTYMDTFKGNMFASWGDVAKRTKPIIAAVNGFALGGGCELAMMCDIIIAGENAQFGQPEVTIGTIPGGGGTQRLIRAVGKSKAMELILTGDRMGAAEAASYGLVSKVVPVEDTVPTAVAMAGKIASFSQPIIAMAKEATNAAYEGTQESGLLFERRLFHSTFATADQKEGMGAFAAKRAPAFTHR